MDYFGQLIDDLTDLYEIIETSEAAPDAGEVLRALQRVMVAAAKAETLRSARPCSPSPTEENNGVSSADQPTEITTKKAA